MDITEIVTDAEKLLPEAATFLAGKPVTVTPEPAIVTLGALGRVQIAGSFTITKV